MAGSGSGAPDSNVGTPPMSADLHALSPLEKVSTPVLNGEFSEQRSRVALIWAHLGDPADQRKEKMGLGLGMGMGCSLRRPATWHAVVAVFLQVGLHTIMFFF